MSYQQHLAQIADDMLIDQNKIDNFQVPDEKAFIKSAEDYQDALIKHHINPEKATGATLPWEKTWEKFRARPAELSYIAGYKGHKKSMCASHMFLDFIMQNNTAGIASFEMTPIEILDRMASQSLGFQNGNEKALTQFFSSLKNRLYIYDQQGTVETDRVIRMAEYCAYELGLGYLCVDSMMKCGMAVDNYTAQKNFCNKLDAIARDTGMHIFLVLHMTKPPKDPRYIPTAYDIAGGNDVINQAANIFTCWSDMEKKAQMAMPEELRDRSKTHYMVNGEEREKYDVIINLANQRHGSFEGKFGLFFDDKSLQLIERRSTYTKSYVR